ncbi:winged helix-turn-helix transcriptional regulator [Nocardia aobensis]|uniref:Winged helix-turn-helix transcriptional regulator n=1 Tax=Nocardia aobensis TaxID=257277 RepID=A0ABW6NYP2_9NOCA|nr:helix-turn-helix domain-containing protein [Nocardia sp. MDA0666]PSR68682.1 transcriptional regulator [Nocardia sp. MDA0666]
MSGYGEFCPIAKAMDVLDERWTLLVVRELLLGSTHFNELRRGNPKMSPALLSRRLRSLERSGVLRREIGVDGRAAYILTDAGRELSTVVQALGAWGVRWIGDLGDRDLDPHLLLWDIRRTIPIRAWPDERTVLAVEFTDVPGKEAHWWLLVERGTAAICDYDPGFEVAATVRSTLRQLTEIWRGDRSWAAALRDETTEIVGPASIRRQVPHWIGQASLAATPRPERAE